MEGEGEKVLKRPLDSASEMEDEGQKALKRPLINSPPEMADEGKEKRPSASVTAAASSRMVPERASDARVRAYQEMRRQVKGPSFCKGRKGPFEFSVVEGKLVRRLSRYAKLPPVPGPPTKPIPGVVYPKGAPSSPPPSNCFICY